MKAIAAISHPDPTIAEVIALMARMDDMGKGILLGTARMTAKAHPVERNAKPATVTPIIARRSA